MNYPQKYNAAVGLICSTADGKLDLGVIARGFGEDDPYSALVTGLQLAKQGGAAFSKLCSEPLLNDLLSRQGALDSYAQKLAALEPLAAIEMLTRSSGRGFAVAGDNLTTIKLVFDSDAWRFGK